MSVSFLPRIILLPYPNFQEFFTFASKWAFLKVRFNFNCIFSLASQMCGGSALIRKMKKFYEELRKDNNKPTHT